MKLPLPLIAVLTLWAFTSCSPAPDLERSSKKERVALAQDGLFASAAAPAPAAPAPSESAPFAERKQIKNGSVTLEVADLDAAEGILTKQVAAFGGFVENTQAQDRYRSLVLRVPAARFDGFLGGLTGVGRVTAKQVGVSDVTVQFYDLETRLKNQKLLLDQYRVILAKTVRLEDTLTAMEKINALTTDMESNEGQFRYLSRQIDLSTLTVELNLPLAQGGRDWPDWSQGFSTLVHTLADWGVGAVFVVAGAVVVVPVVGLLLWFLLWLLTGPLGLGRRITDLFPRRRRTPKRH